MAGLKVSVVSMLLAVLVLAVTFIDASPVQNSGPPGPRLPERRWVHTLPHPPSNLEKLDVVARDAEAEALELSELDKRQTTSIAAGKATTTRNAKILGNFVPVPTESLTVGQPYVSYEYPQTTVYYTDPVLFLPYFWKTVPNPFAPGGASFTSFNSKVAHSTATPCTHHEHTASWKKPLVFSETIASTDTPAVPPPSPTLPAVTPGSD